MKYLKKLISWGIIAAILYAFLGYHYIFFGKTPKILKKSELTLNYTFFSTQGKSLESILSIDELRNDGMGELLLEMGLITEKDLDRLLTKIDEKKQAKP